VDSRTPGRLSVKDNWRVSTSVLIVDDHPSFRAGARRMLEASGYSVIGEAADGEAAIDAVRELGPDLVLLDVQLPGIDGFEVAARLAGAGAAATIVLTSSRDRADFGDALAESPARGFIAKGELSGAALAELTG
jgi:DNA-binding NarL/FixJ family response regulator